MKDVHDFGSEQETLYSTGKEDDRESFLPAAQATPVLLRKILDELRMIRTLMERAE